MITVKNLSKNYGERVAIENLNFEVKKGEVVGFLGPNGAGKSTTMKIVTGMLAASSGQVLVDGLDTFDHPLETKKKIGFLPEFPPLYEDMVVEDYLVYVAKLARVPEKNIAENVYMALEATSLLAVRGRYIQHLSKGFRQRVGISQALVSQPDILILDEPTVGLDPKQVSQIRELLLSFKGKYTVVLSTHILSEVQATCDRAIIIDQGRIIAEDSIENLQKNIMGKQQVFIKVLRNQDQVVADLKKMDLNMSVNKTADQIIVELPSGKEDLEQISSKIVQLNAGLVEFHVRSQMDLEQVFLQLTSKENPS